MACFSDIKGIYNPLRRHSALGYRSPVVYEQGTGIVVARHESPPVIAGCRLSRLQHLKMRLVRAVRDARGGRLIEAPTQELGLRLSYANGSVGRSRRSTSASETRADFFE